MSVVSMHEAWRNFGTKRLESTGKVHAEALQNLMVLRQAVNRCYLRRYVLKNLMRDWGAEGAAERSQSYGKVVAELKKRLLPSGASPPLPIPPRVLVPGAGLGRLCVDIASLGCEAQVRYRASGSAFAYSSSTPGSKSCPKTRPVDLQLGACATLQW